MSAVHLSTSAGAGTSEVGELLALSCFISETRGNVREVLCIVATDAFSGRVSPDMLQFGCATQIPSFSVFKMARNCKLSFSQAQGSVQLEVDGDDRKSKKQRSSLNGEWKSASTRETRTVGHRPL